MTTSRQRSSYRKQQDGPVWTQHSPMLRHAVCLCLLLVVTLAFFSPVVFEGKGVQGVDVVSWRANAEPLIEYQERTGEQGLWSPNVFGGMPAFMIKYNTVVPQLDNVIGIFRSDAFPVGHFFVLLIGAYLLVFYLTRNHFSGLLSAIAFGLTTYIPIILAVGHNTKFVALAYAPYVLLAFAYTLRTPSFLGGLLFSGALSLSLRAKHPQITYYVLMLALVWWIVELVHAWRNDEIVPFAKSTGWLGLGTVLALLMVAQPYLPIYQYKQYSVRGAAAAASGEGGGGMGWQKAMKWSQGVKELLTLVMAEAFGGGGRTYWGPKTFTEGPHYVGAVVVALSGLAVWRGRHRVTWGIGAGTLVTILFALGKNAAWLNWPMFQLFPFFDSFRAPETWLSVTSLGLAVLAGVGFDYVLRPSDSRDGDVTRSLLYTVGAVAGLILLLLVGRGALFDFENPRETQVVEQIRERPNLTRSNPKVQQFYRQLERRKSERQEAFQSSATRSLLALGVVLLLLWLYRRKTLSAWIAGGLVVLVVLIDLWGVDRRYLGEDQFSPQEDREKKIPTYAVDRFLKKKVKQAEGPGHFRVYPFQSPHKNDAYPSYHYQSVSGYHAAKLQRYQDFLDHILGGTNKEAPNENALDLINARYIIAKQRLPGTEVVYRGDNDFQVLKNPDAVPRGFFVGETDVLEEPRDTWARLRNSSFDPRGTALLPEPLDAPVTPIDSASTTEVSLASYEPPEIEWTVRTDAPRLFVASEVYYPAGWNAYLDGEQVPIHRVDYLLRGVHVPEGEHTLVMRFEPEMHQVGVWVAGSTTALVYGGALFLIGARLRRRWGEPNAEREEAEE